MKTLLFIFGTRPEAIKLAPLIKLYNKHSNYVVKVCVTGQHREMLDQVLSFFSITPDYDLNLMKPGQSLFSLTADALTKLEPVLDDCKPSLIFVQGDTTTVLTGALAAFYKKIKVAYVEAGLRSFDKYNPFPEEMNRLLTTRLSDFHFVPTQQSKKNLADEGIFENVFIVGNTVIDALKLGLSQIADKEKEFQTYFEGIDFTRKVILVTCHRRESFGEPFKNICTALNTIAAENPDVTIVYPVHLNPNIKDIAHQLLTSPNIKLLTPLSYPHLIWLMNASYLVLTDSGGVQEEAPTLGKPVLVLRNVTERMEGVLAGTAKLVGTETKVIVDAVHELLHNSTKYNEMAMAINPYGDGTTSQQIISIIDKQLDQIH